MAPATCSPDVEDLVLDHLWLADVIARRYRGRGEADDDLKQVARCALLEAARRYNPERGPFAAYAEPTINGVLKRHFRDRAWTVRPPRGTQQLAVQIAQRWSDVAQERRSVPQDGDLAVVLGEKLSAIREARRAGQCYRAVPLDAGSAPIGPTSSEDPEFERCEARMLIERSWRLLDTRDRDLLRMRYWECRSQSDIAGRTGVSQMQVSRQLSRILDRLRTELSADGTL